jgi:hypothetical protein
MLAAEPTNPTPLSVRLSHAMIRPAYLGSPVEMASSGEGGNRFQELDIGNSSRSRNLNRDIRERRMTWFSCVTTLVAESSKSGDLESRSNL